MTTRSRGISVNMEPKLFPTKKAAKDFVKKYLHDQFTINGRNSGIAKISGSELPWTTSLLKMHHRWDSYRDIDYIGVGPDPKFGNNGTFAVVMKDGTIDYPSYHTCIDGYDETRSMKRAMRQAIEGQIQEFKTSVFSPKNKIICELCRTELHNDHSTHIDHIVEFATLVKQFLLLKKIAVIPTQNGDKIWNTVFVNDLLRKEWVDFHKENARLRPLCSTCNTTRNA
jgi:hypothetical protein